MRLDEVWFRYARRGDWALREVSLTLTPGSTVVVEGRNGAGKSTLLSILAGVLRPTRGTLRDPLGPVGWVPERFPAGQPFTVDGYLRAMAGVAGIPAHTARAAVHDWTARLGLDPFRATRLSELSKGTAQKVGLAQAMLPGPRLLILDEPWEGLDAATRELVPQLVTEVVEAGGVAVVSDHRGETGRLPGALTWTVTDRTVAVAEPGPAVPARPQPPGQVTDPPGWVIEVEVSARDDPQEAAALLRAQGHRVLRVRSDARTPGRAGGAA